MSYYTKPDNYCRSKKKVELDLTKYATKYDMKNVTGVHTSDFAQRVNLACLQSRSKHQRCSVKKLVFKMLQYSPENTCVGVSFE